MRKRSAYKPNDKYKQIEIDEAFFKGVACCVMLQNIARPKYVKKGEKTICIIGNSNSLIEAYPDGGKYALTIMFDDNGTLVEWYL